eukprot:1145786-Pelagomonas_calceolata.AAC.2
MQLDPFTDMLQKALSLLPVELDVSSRWALHGRVKLMGFAWTCQADGLCMESLRKELILKR